MGIARIDRVVNPVSSPTLLENLEPAYHGELIPCA